MLTIKLPYKSQEDLTPVLKQYSSVVRFSYNRFKEDKSEKEVRALTASLINTDLLNSWLVQCGIKDAKAIHKRFKNQKVIFGGKHNFVNRLKKKISKEEFCINRLSPVNIQGEELKQGNRSFKIDIIDNNQIIFKLNRTKHLEFKLPNLRNNLKKQLIKLQQLNELKQGQKGHTFSIRFDLKYIYISFDEFKDEVFNSDQLLENRCMGLDLNPDTIGISILDNEHVIYVQEFSLKGIFKDILNQKLSSDSNKMKYLQNKLRFETIEISKVIAVLARQYKCKTVYIEDLHFKGCSSNKVSNRKNNNLWKKDLFINNLSKRLNILNIKLYKVNPAYSSFIGNLQYQYSDAVNASIEIARRGFEYRVRKNKKGFYPNLNVKHQWKEMATLVKDWKELFLKVKNSELRYRVSLDDLDGKFKVFEMKSHKSKVIIYNLFV